MNRETIINEYKALSDSIDAIANKSKELDKNESLSNQGRMEALERFIDEQGITSKANKLSSDLEALIDELEGKWADALISRLEDKDYQDALTVASDAIAGGYLNAPRDLDAVAAKFAGDHVALTRLNLAALSRKISVARFAAPDQRERVLGNLANMASDVKSITPASVKNDALTASLKLQGNMEYLQVRVDDSFNYIPHGVEQVS